ncbi:hypothetical protein GRI38_13800 [Altererythrobacter aurantiacus]|uniref:Uncharacterized protein n=1 Tax=Parapontixanthobacter aurantiacus TaxID=1463599 RepID=A0A844ZIL0_9SPHN|nr:hypothetical protein [Parapontixanthobacter aurantiacus]MXO87102.1 hypothetical protein [Parapontixanthobacter aurantiacus]
MTQVISHPAWVLSHVINIDERVAGFCGTFLRGNTSAERRQVIAAYLAAKPLAEDRLYEIGRFLFSADHRSILVEAHGRSIAGMRGALRRAGPTVHDERFYTLLHQLLSSPPHKQIARTIASLQSLDLPKLLILRMLPECLARAHIVEVIDSLGDNPVRQAHDVTEAYNLLIELEVDGAALTEAIRRVRSSDEFANLWHRWALKAKCCVPHPVPSAAQYQPIESAAEAKVVARKFRNCMAIRYTLGLLRGIDFFATYRHNDEEAVVHLRRQEDVTEFEGMYGPRNARPSVSLRCELESFLAQNGIRVRSQEHEKHSPWNSLRRMMRGPFDFDLG